ncbi:hypothetical protein Agub_g11990, partial [Astrephomene gubernaculifera]
RIPAAPAGTDELRVSVPPPFRLPLPSPLPPIPPPPCPCSLPAFLKTPPRPMGHPPQIASLLLEQFRPSELPAPSARSWLAAPPPARADPGAHLAAFPPACCLAPLSYFEGWSGLLPEYIKLHCLQAPGHGSRRGEDSLLRLSKLVPPSTAAINSGLPPDAPLALFGVGLGALWAFEVARRLECLYRRPLVHLFVCACAAPQCFPGRNGSEGGVGAGGGEAGGAAGGGGGAGGSPMKRFEPWRTSAPAAAAAPSGSPQQQQQPQQPPAYPGAPELYELPDEGFITACRNHPRCSKQLRTNVKALVEHVPLLRADIEMEMTYNFTPPPPSLCASVAAVLASVTNRADEEARVSQGLLSCPITVITPEDDTALTTELTAPWDKCTEGQVRFLSVPGDYHCLEDR